MSSAVDQSDLDEDVDSERGSDEEYSPGSLVIDTEGGDSSSLPSTPYNSNPDMSKPFLDHTSFSGDALTSTVPLVRDPPPTLTLGTPSQAPQPAVNTQGHMTKSPVLSLTPLPVQLHPHTSTPPQQSPFGCDASEGVNVPPVVSLRQRVLVSSKENTPPVDTLTIYNYHWRDVQLDILVTNHHPAYIPIKNIYQKAIPGLKQNVLSARISKHGIRSLVLSEPYVSTLKRLDLGLTGSSHYITIPDFFKICGYFKYLPPEDLYRFRYVSADNSPGDVLEMFNNPEGVIGRRVLEQLCSDAVSGVGGGRSSDNSSPALTSVEEGDGSTDEMVTEGKYLVDGRHLFLPGGQAILLLIRGGVPFIPNPELAKILPNVTRAAMDVIRNACGIIVQQSTKHEINLMKHLGIVSPKAGRTLLYNVTDIAKMYEHWKITIPDYIYTLCAGKVPTDKIDLTMYPRLTDSPSHTLPPSPLTSSQLSRPKRKNWRKPKKPKSEIFDMDDHRWVGQGGGYVGGQGAYGGSGLVHGVGVGSGTQQPLWMKGSDVQPVPVSGPPPSSSSHIPTPSYLTPEWFQQPVKLLNSILSTSSDSSHVTGSSTYAASTSSHVTTQNFMSPSGTKVQGLKGKRRNSSTSGPPLDDTDLEYSSLMWGDHSLSLLIPTEDEPHLLVPELIHKVFHDRSYLSPQRRSQLGVLTVPATSLQIHALRARGSLGNFTGNVKLLALSDAVKVAVSSNIQIPGTVIKTLQAHANLLPEPIEVILGPTLSPAHPHSSHPSQATPHPSQSPQPSTGIPASSSSTEYPTVPAHPDVIDLGRGFHLGNSLVCQMKWGDLKLVVYLKSRGEYYMGLYQVYEDLFKVYVTRVNFKMRMRKLHIRSIRAAPIVRVKLIEIGALPSHCPVCGLILVSQVESLAKSYGVVPPNVMYEAFLSSAVHVASMAPPISQPKLGRPKKVAVHQEHPKPISSGPQQVSSSLKEHNVFMYEFPTGAHPMNIINQSPAGGVSVVNAQSALSSSQANPIGRSDNDKLVSPVYGFVPYLTSSRGEPPTSKILPNLLMTSSPPMPTDQIFAPVTSRDEVGPLVVSIPRSLTPFNHTQSLISSGFNPLPTNPAATLESFASDQDTSVSLGGSRRKVLQNLAKKIAQKSRKFTTNSLLVTSRSQPMGSPYNPHLSVSAAAAEMQGQSSSSSLQDANRLCTSCRMMNPQHKKRCVYCASFLMGRTCPNCGSLNHNRAKSCTQCRTSMPYTWKRESGNKTHTDQLQSSNSLVTTLSTTAEGGRPTGVGVASVSPTSSSPTSPKFSAPPIRSAVLKNLFPQDSRRVDGAEPSTSTGSNGQLLTKTMFLGNLSSSRKCPECGQLNSRMAKKCVQCRSHLQGRACNRCGRPNLSIVSECHKCGAPLPPPTAATKWVYKGGRGGRAYKTVENPEEKILESSAPISCIRCNKVRMSNYFKCGRCGDVFKTRPVVDKPLELRDEDEDKKEATNHKKIKLSHDAIGSDLNGAASTSDPAALQQFARNILSLDLSEQLAPLITTREEESRRKIPQAEEELELAETNYQTFLQKKQLLETAYQNLEAELNGLIREAEKQTSLSLTAHEAERQAEEMAETLPDKINELKEKIENIGKLIFSENREM